MRTIGKIFLHYWLGGLALLISASATLTLTMFLPRIIHGVVFAESGDTIKFGSWVEVAFALIEFTALPFLLGWLLHKAVRNKQGVVSTIVRNWITSDPRTLSPMDHDPDTGEEHRKHTGDEQDKLP